MCQTQQCIDELDTLDVKLKRVDTCRIELAAYFCEEVHAFRLDECFKILHAFKLRYTRAAQVCPHVQCNTCVLWCRTIVNVSNDMRRQSSDGATTNGDLKVYTLSGLCVQCTHHCTESTNALSPPQLRSTRVTLNTDQISRRHSCALSATASTSLLDVLEGYGADVQRTVRQRTHAVPDARERYAHMTGSTT